MSLLRNLIIRDWRRFDANERRRLSAIRTTEIETSGRDWLEFPAQRAGSDFSGQHWSRASTWKWPAERSEMSFPPCDHRSSLCNFLESRDQLPHARKSRQKEEHQHISFLIIKWSDRSIGRTDATSIIRACPLHWCANVSLADSLSFRFDCLGETPANRNYTNSSTESATGRSRRSYPGPTGLTVESRPGALD